MSLELPPLPEWLREFDWSDGYWRGNNDKVKAEVIADVQDYARQAQRMALEDLATKLDPAGAAIALEMAKNA